ncbi:hypothetical protein AAG906_035503 [Vitis piasezkii]
MKNQALELHSPLPKSFKVCKERTAAVFFCTFGALPEVHFLHSIYHFKAQEVKNPILQTVCNLELKRRSYSHCKQITPKSNQTRGFFLEDEKLGSLSLGVRKAGKHPLVISCELLTGNPRLKITLNVTGTLLLYEEPEPSDLNSKKQLFFVINFVDYSLNQGAPLDTNHETPIGHESNGASGKNQMEAMNFMSYMAEVSRG